MNYTTDLEQGSVLMLKSGSLPMTVKYVSGIDVTCVYQNPVTGKLDEVTLARGLLQKAAAVSMGDIFKSRSR